MPSEEDRTGIRVLLAFVSGCSVRCYPGDRVASLESARGPHQVRLRGGRAARERLRVGRVALEQPRAVGTAYQLAALGELGQGGRDGRAAGADELAEDPVRERQRHDHALAGDPAPALGEMPEE